ACTKPGGQAGKADSSKADGKKVSGKPVGDFAEALLIQSVGETEFADRRPESHSTVWRVHGPLPATKVRPRTAKASHCASHSPVIDDKCLKHSHCALQFEQRPWPDSRANHMEAPAPM